jgi:hypothetical protein
METIVVGHDGLNMRERALRRQVSGAGARVIDQEPKRSRKCGLGHRAELRVFGLLEYELRSELEDELVRAEGEAPQRMAAQLERAGVHVNHQE